MNVTSVSSHPFPSLIQHNSRTILLLFLPLTSLILLFLYRLFLHPLSHIPGPSLSALTRIPLLFTFLRERQHLEYASLHAQYGPVVRISPNTVLFDDPTGDTEKRYFEWDKSDWWRAFRIDPENVPHSNELDARVHGVKKRRVMGGYSMSRVVGNEEAMDGIIEQFVEQMRGKCRKGAVFDLAPWLQYVAFDVAMEMVFSNPVGFVKAGEDVGGLIASLHALLVGGAVVALFPMIPKILQCKWWWKWFEPSVNAEKGPGRIRGLAYEQVRKRIGEEAAGKEKHKDILQWILEKEGKEGERLSRVMLEQEGVGPVVAGSDSTAACMRAVVLYVASNPRVLRKLQREIDAADKQGLLSAKVVKWEEVKKHVPYVEAVCKEGLRIFPIVGSPLFRVAPKGGVEVQGHWIPEETEIGFSQWAVARNKNIWGEDADEFRPERWLEDMNVEERRVRDAGDVFFGSGVMMCTGRNVAHMEMHKIVCEFFRRVEVEVVNPLQPWKMRNGLAIIHWDFWVRLTERGKDIDREG